MSETKKQNFLRGAAILATTVAIVKIIGAIYKIPLYNLLGDEGTAKFSLTYLIYSLLFTISTAGIPVALSRLISSANATGRTALVKRYFRIALPVFSLIGIFFMVIMFLYADKLAVLMGDKDIAIGIRALAPAVLFGCIISVYRGYAQGHENMVPTAISQVTEVLCKMIFGLGITLWFLHAGFPTPVVTAGAIVGVTIGLGLAIPILMFYKRKIDRTPARYTSARIEDTPRRSEVFSAILKVSIPITLGAAFMTIMTLIDTRLVLHRLQSGAGFSFEQAMIFLGVYNKGLTLLNLPTAFIVPITVSIIPAIAGAIANHKLKESRHIMESSIKLVNLLAMPAGIGLCVLSYPIFNVLYWNSNDKGPTLLAIFGIAAYFVCMQLITTAILQANGHEKIPILIYPIAGVIQIVLDWILVGNPNIGIVGSPIGTLTCYFIITALNILFIVIKVKNLPNMARVFIKPALCTAVMGVAAWSVYELLYKVGSGIIGTGRMSLAVFLIGAITTSIILYAILIITTKTITRDDMKLLPKGEKLANFLKIK